MKENTDKPNEELHGEQFDKGGWEEQREEILEEAMEKRDGVEEGLNAPEPVEEPVEEPVVEEPVVEEPVVEEPVVEEPVVEEPVAEVAVEASPDPIMLGFDKVENKPLFANQAAANWAIEIYNNSDRLESSLKNDTFEIDPVLREVVGAGGIGLPMTFVPDDEGVIRFIAELIVEVSEEPDPDPNEDKVPVYFVEPNELTNEEALALEKQKHDAATAQWAKEKGLGEIPKIDENVLDEDGKLE